MDQWIYQNVLLPALGMAMADVPATVWVIVAGIAAGWVWKQFGWQGLVGLGLALLTLGAYRQGWRDATAAQPPPKPPAPVPLPPINRNKAASSNPLSDFFKKLTGG